MLSTGWIGAGGIPLTVALVPLLLVSAQYGDTWKETLYMLGYAALAFTIWNAATIWWVGKATPFGPIAAAFFSVFWNLVAFMLFHIVSKKGPIGLAYILLIFGWISTEFIYHEAPALSFPWLQLGNGFSNDTWAVQWYEYTGTLGGTLWVLLVNVLAFQALITMKKTFWTLATLAFAVPLAISGFIFWQQSPENTSTDRKPTICVSVTQPNIDCYDKMSKDSEYQQQILMELMAEAPDSADYILMPETALAEYIYEDSIEQSPIVNRISTALAQRNIPAMVISGCETVRSYGQQKITATARNMHGSYYDIYNSSIGINAKFNIQIHHKNRLVVGVETLPAWLRSIHFGEVDLGGTFGQLGIGDTLQPFTNGETKVAPAICYEGLYDNTMAEYVRNGAQALFVVTNDGWWGDTPGHRYLFSFCRLRAIETRRMVARSANTGVSGFISARGDDLERMEWYEQGILTRNVELSDRLTFYVRYGDYIGRLSLLISLLCILYFIAYRAKKKFYLN